MNLWRSGLVVGCLISYACTYLSDFVFVSCVSWQISKTNMMKTRQEKLLQDWLLVVSLPMRACAPNHPRPCAATIRCKVRCLSNMLSIVRRFKCKAVENLNWFKMARGERGVQSTSTGCTIEQGVSKSSSGRGLNGGSARRFYPHPSIRLLPTNRQNTYQNNHHHS